MVQKLTSGSAEYRQIKALVDRTYPAGWFVAVANGQVLGADAEFRSLESTLRTRGIDPRSALVIEAGVDYPDNVDVFI
jgi:hypothetical protein